MTVTGDVQDPGGPRPPAPGHPGSRARVLAGASLGVAVAGLVLAPPVAAAVAVWLAHRARTAAGPTDAGDVTRTTAWTVRVAVGSVVVWVVLVVAWWVLRP